MVSPLTSRKKKHQATEILGRMQQRLRGLIERFSDDLTDPGVSKEIRATNGRVAEVEAGTFKYVLLRIPASLKRPLTDRESEIAGMVLEGHSNKEIARRLGIRVSTVAAHLRRMYDKCGVSSRTGLALFLVGRFE